MKVRKGKRLMALLLALALIFTNTAFAAVLDTEKSDSTLSGYRMGAYRVVDSTFTWKGVGHDHMVLATAVKTSGNKTYTGFCLNAGKYWGENSGIYLTSDSRLDPDDTRNYEIIRTLNYWNNVVFKKNGTTFNATAVTVDMAVKYAILQCYIWGIVDDAGFISKSTSTQATEIAAVLGGKRFGSSYYGYTVYSQSSILSTAQSLITAVKAYTPTYKTEVLVSNNASHQDVAFIISYDELIEYGSVRLSKVSKLNNYQFMLGNTNYSLEGAEFTLYYNATSTPNVLDKVAGIFKTDAGGNGHVTVNNFGTINGSDIFTMTNLPLGNYLVVETKVPQGHKKAANQTFSITKNNKEAAITINIEEPAIYGELDLVKKSGCASITNNNSMYDLSGAVYTVYTDAECTKQAKFITVDANGKVTGVTDASFTTDSTGNAPEAHILFGTYYLKETTAPEGYEMDTGIYKVVVGTENTAQTNVTISSGTHSYDSYKFTVNVTDKPVEDPLSIKIQKADSNGNIVTGGMSLEGTIFKVSYYDGYYSELSSLPAKATRNWYLQIKEQNDGTFKTSLEDQFLVNDSAYKSDEFYITNDRRITLPLGTVTVSEVKAAPGFVSESGTVKDDNGNEYSNRTFIGHVKEDADSPYGASLFGINGITQNVKFTNLALDITNDVIRGNVKFSKNSVEDKSGMADVLFRISYLNDAGTVIESHEIKTDSTGKFDSSTSDLYFYGNDSHTGTKSTKGALPYGNYILEELPCASNSDRQLMDPVSFSVSTDNQTVDLGTLYNSPKPEIGTMEWDKDTETHMSVADKEVSIIDTVEYKYLTAGTTYTLQGILMEVIEDKDGNKSVKPLLDDNGDIITGSTVFTTLAATDEELNAYNKCGSVDVNFRFSGATLAGKTFVIYEYLFVGEKSDSLTVTDEEPDAEGATAGHADMNDDDQIGYFPEGSTTALGKDTGDHTVAPKTEVSIIDTVSYINLHPGKEYKVTGTVMIKESGEALTDADGNAVTATVAFIPENSDGSVDVTFTFNSSELAGKQLVVFEEVYYNGISVFVHADIDDEGQTITVMDKGGLRGLKTDADTGAGLEGAVIGIYDADTTVFTKDTAIAVTTSAADGSFSFSELLFGEYIVREIEAPEGYCLSDVSVPVVIDEDGEVIEITIVNSKRVGALKIVKTSSNDVVKGFTFMITGCGMEFTAVTDENGEIFIDNLPLGEYTVHEVSNTYSAEYKLPEDKKCVIIDESVTIVEMHNVYNPEIPPQTGDNNNLIVLFVIFIAAALLLALCCRRKNN